MTMRPSQVKRAEEEVRRFLVRVQDLRDAGQLPKVIIDNDKDWYLHGSKETGAIRRASLDLTRALAAMRKG